MRTTPPQRSVAELLLTIEKASGVVEPGRAVTRVYEKLGAMLGRLLGTAGFWALLSRALTLAQAESDELAGVQVNPDGSLAGLERVGRRGEIVLVAHTLGLLVTFIGAGLTIRLLQDVWSDAAIAKLDEGRSS